MRNKKELRAEIARLSRLLEAEMADHATCDYERDVALPDFGQQLAAKGGPIPADIEKRIIEKGG